jgi:hypothetical protein
MNKIFYLIFPFLISGCSILVKPSFPDIPKNLDESCPELQEAKKDSDKLSDLLKTVTINYGQYHECSIKVQAWSEWYKKQKKIFEGSE